MLVSVFYKYPTNRGTLRSSNVAHRSDGGWRRGQTLTTTTTIQLEQEKCKDVRRDTLPPRRQGSTTTSIVIIRKERDGIGQDRARYFAME